jgi:hypothetical protein
MTSSSEMIVQYAKSTQNMCICLAISLFLIIVFIMTPLNNFILSSILSKIIILLLLGYIIYYTITKTNKFTNDFNVSLTSGNWNVLKTNIICSYIFSFFLIILMVSIIRQIF